MKKIFDINNPVWVFVSRLCDAFLLHLCWILCCLPVVTFGASTTALYYAMMKDVADEETHYVRAVFRSFKENLLQGSIIGLIYLAVGGLLVYALYIYTQTGSENEFFAFLNALAYAFIFIYIFSFVYVFPLQARFYNTVPGTIKNSFLFAVKYFGWTLAMSAVLIAVYVILIYFGFLPLALIGHGLVALINSYMLNRIFEPYIREGLAAQQKEKEEDSEWHIPDPSEIPDSAASGIWPPVKEQ